MNVAIKQMVIAKQAKKEVLTNEILIMKESHHDNIVNFLDAYMVDGEIWVWRERERVREREREV